MSGRRTKWIFPQEHLQVSAGLGIILDSCYSLHLWIMAENICQVKVFSYTMAKHAHAEEKSPQAQD